MTNDLVHGLLEVGDEALWIWSHALIASTLGAQELDADFEFIPVNLLAGEHIGIESKPGVVLRTALSWCHSSRLPLSCSPTDLDVRRADPDSWFPSTGA
jgi:hypothetical protein